MGSIVFISFLSRILLLHDRKRYDHQIDVLFVFVYFLFLKSQGDAYCHTIVCSGGDNVVVLQPGDTEQVLERRVSAPVIIPSLLLRDLFVLGCVWLVARCCFFTCGVTHVRSIDFYESWSLFLFYGVSIRPSCCRYRSLCLSLPSWSARFVLSLLCLCLCA